MGRYDPVEFCGTVKWETTAAFLVNDGTNDVWIPKSQIQEHRKISAQSDDFEFIIPEWLAIEKGII